MPDDTGHEFSGSTCLIALNNSELRLPVLTTKLTRQNLKMKSWCDGLAYKMVSQ